MKTRKSILIIPVFFTFGFILTMLDIANGEDVQTNIPQLEKQILTEIKNNGPGSRFVIPELKPGGLDLSSTTLSATVTLEGDSVKLILEFPDDRIMTSMMGFTGFSIYSDKPNVTNTSYSRKENLKDILFAQEGWGKRCKVTIGSR